MKRIRGKKHEDHSRALPYPGRADAATSQAFAADYNFETPAPSDYYGSTSYEEVYGAQYNYGGINAVDFLDPLAENAVSTTTGATLQYGINASSGSIP